MAGLVKNEPEKLDLERTYTPEEFEALPQFDELYELVDGKLVAKPMPGDAHGRITKRLERKLAVLDPTEKLGMAWRDTTFDVGTGWMPIPDLGFLTASRVPPESEKSIRGVPDLVVEVHSPSDLDSKAGRDAAAKKIGDWQAVGVQIVWAVNSRTRTVEVYRQGQPQPQVLQETDQLDGEDVIKGFIMPVTELFG